MHVHAHGHEHGHSHAHGHQHDLRQQGRRQLRVVLVLVIAYMIAEVVGGVLTNSLALLADAGHMLSDAGALALALFALWIAEKPATPRWSYGFYRTEILAALVNGATLVAISVFIFIEALQRLREPPVVQGPLMFAIASGGLAVNLIGLWVLRSGHSHSLNVRGAWLHVLTDALGSAGAMLAGILIWQFGWIWADPAVSILIGMLVIVSAWNLLRETVAVLMESAPANIDVDAVRDVMLGVPGVGSVHDLHVWSITSGMIALSAHVHCGDVGAGDELLTALRRALRDRFGIDHVTIQIEREPGCEQHVHR